MKVFKAFIKVPGMSEVKAIVKAEDVKEACEQMANDFAHDYDVIVDPGDIELEEIKRGDTQFEER